MKTIEKSRGFSVIELLSVAAIIGLIAAIAIPNFLASRRASNEASALSALRTIGSAQSVYHSTGGDRNYGTAADLYAQSLIDRAVAAANNVNVGGSRPRIRRSPVIDSASRRPRLSRQPVRHLHLLFRVFPKQPPGPRRLEPNDFAWPITGL